MRAGSQLASTARLIEFAKSSAPLRAGAQGEADEQGAEAATFELVEEGHLGAGACQSEVVAAFGNDDRALRQLFPADRPRSLEPGQFELVLCLIPPSLAVLA
jgi:hypothetical protein